MLAVIGTMLAWFPILAPILLTIVMLVAEGEFRFDYLMPAELFLFALAGGLLLIWAAIRARSRRGMIAWSLGLAAGLLVGSQALAVATGLASGETQPGGWQWALVLTALVGFILALVTLAVSGVLLLRDLFRPALPPKAGAKPAAGSPRSAQVHMDDRTTLPPPAVEQEPGRPAAWIARHQIALFFTLSLALSWIVYLCLALFPTGEFNRWTLVAGFGPSAAGILVAWLADPQRDKGRPILQLGLFLTALAVVAGVEWLDHRWWYHRIGTTLIVSDAVLVLLAASVIAGVLSSRRAIRDLLQGLTRWRVGPGWYLVAFLLWPALVLTGNALARLLGLDLPGHPYYLTRIPAAILAVESFFWYLFFGGPLNEEAGWRGFAQVRLQRRTSPLIASVIVGAFWGLWHVPVHLLGLYPGGPAGAIIRIFDIPRAVIFTWLFNRTRQSLLPVLILHAVVNTTSLFLPRNYLTSSLLILVLAIVLALLDKMWRPWTQASRVK
jgi:membrane protease YdiL (CAAX protease family)